MFNSTLEALKCEAVFFNVTLYDEKGNPTYLGNDITANEAKAIIKTYDKVRIRKGTWLCKNGILTVRKCKSLLFKKFNMAIKRELVSSLKG